jgi:hypothetical protein
MKKIHVKVWSYILVVSISVSQVISPILVLSDTQEQETISEADQSSSEEDVFSEVSDTVEDTFFTNIEDTASNESVEDTVVPEETKETKSTTKSVVEDITDQLLEKGSLMTNSNH